MPRWLPYSKIRGHSRLQRRAGIPCSGGKRVRPALCFAMHSHCGRSTWSTALVNVATSVELIHTYSLVHDDLPCLDNDDERRGRPTVHIAYDEGTALLVGDALLTEAFALLARQPLPAETVVALIQELSTASGHLGMIGGQAADIGLNGPVETLETLKRLHRLKTGALLTVSATMGARVARADPGGVARQTVWGDHWAGVPIGRRCSRRRRRCRIRWSPLIR